MMLILLWSLILPQKVLPEGRQFFFVEICAICEWAKLQIGMYMVRSNFGILEVEVIIDLLHSSNQGHFHSFRYSCTIKYVKKTKNGFDK